MVASSSALFKSSFIPAVSPSFFCGLTEHFSSLQIYPDVQANMSFMSDG
jgi:hypothetical protein